jgi:hypothetical protein
MQKRHWTVIYHHANRHPASEDRFQDVSSQILMRKPPEGVMNINLDAALDISIASKKRGVRVVVRDEVGAVVAALTMVGPDIVDQL